MRTNTFVHKYIKGLISKDDTVVDMTAGNGNDTLLLSDLAGKVYAFDINEGAIASTKKRLEGHDNVQYICDNHINVDSYIDGGIRLFVFNLGYLPHSETPDTTKAKETLTAFRKAYDLLADNGYIIMTFYRGHKGGLDEYYLLTGWFADNGIDVIERYEARSSLIEPVTYVIKKTDKRQI
ncbi:MAG: class I SAM-dependent methyltransferase [Erysipelotrichaceae bacterium]|nr:class I SAM-dependent methyltransferase [Erysipelotrichaceae bacterium]